MFDSGTISELRKVALCEMTDCRIRLSAIDAVAAQENVWGTLRHQIPGYREPSIRGRKWIRLALRRLLKSRLKMPKSMPSKIKQRLLALKGIRINDRGIYLPLNRDGKPTSIVDTRPQEVASEPVKPAAHAALSEIERLLAEHGGIQ